MLEVRNLTKIYKTKNAKDVKALDNVSVAFNSTGMVFLLGKSGSGKSTLLNVLGGLDQFDSGEIIIQGRSSKSFKEKDFDSYRNTFLGFVFQEYNILPEFTVFKNISLALELQGKKATKAAVDKLLKEVDLEDYAKRKPNQLSGGQKQRIAIARALIKEPQIILADEPTGALDSNTGKQVLDTLKKLSETKLVIVVSHDREFAEEYGDRIIELKDGKIISDVTKRKSPPKAISSAMDVIGGKILHFKKGHKLSQTEANLLNELLETSEDGIYFSADDSVNKDIKRAARIDSAGNNEYFDKTLEQDHEKEGSNGSDLKLIKSRLKYRDSFKMGASGLKTKKIRLFFTILLAAVSLTLFGISDTMASFNVAKCNYESLSRIGVENVLVSKNHLVVEDDYSWNEMVNANSGDLEKLQARFKNNKMTPVFDVDITFQTKDSVSTYDFYNNTVNGVTCMSESDFAAFGLKLKVGHAPRANDEVAISTYTYDCLRAHGFKEKESVSDSDIMAGSLQFEYSSKTYKIVGVVDTGFSEDGYELLKRERADSNRFYELYYNFENYLKNGLHNVCFFSDSAKSLFENKPRISSDSRSDNRFIVSDRTNAESELSSGYYSDYFCGQGENILGNTIFFNQNKRTLEENEVIVGCNVYASIGGDTGSHFYAYKAWGDEIYFSETGQYYSSLNEFAEALRKLAPNGSLNVTLRVYDDGEYKYLNTYKVVGVCYDFVGSSNNSIEYYGSRCLYFKNSACAPAPIQYLLGNYSSIAVALNGKDKNLIMALSKYDSSKANYLIVSEISETLINFCQMIKMLAKIFLYVSIGFAVFSALLLMNFISVSISYKKKEIGILRALGARGSDVYGIFFNESLLITIINYILSLALTIGGVILINSLVVKNFAIKITLLSFGIRQVLLLLVVSLLVAVIATFLPTHKISKMKPIDAIQERK